MSERRTPAWTARLEEPFSSDRSFSRSVAASADAILLIVVAAAAAVVLGLAGASVGLVVLPFLAPVVMLGLALFSARRFHLGGPTSVTSSSDADVAWRVRERQAVASVFVPALLRNRFSH